MHSRSSSLFMLISCSCRDIVALVLDVAERGVAALVLAPPPALAAALGAHPVLRLASSEGSNFPLGIGGVELVDAAGDPHHVARGLIVAVVRPHLVATQLDARAAIADPPHGRHR